MIHDSSKRQIVFSEEFYRTGWQPDQGWNGLIPDRSTLEDVREKFGEPCDSGELVNGHWYEFCGGMVRATVLKDQKVVSKVWVSGDFTSLVPRTIDDAIAMFGTVKARRVDKLQGIIYERPGLRLACEQNPRSERIEWMEIYRPGQ